MAKVSVSAVAKDVGVKAAILSAAISKLQETSPELTVEHFENFWNGGELYEGFMDAIIKATPKKMVRYVEKNCDAMENVLPQVYFLMVGHVEMAVFLHQKPIPYEFLELAFSHFSKFQMVGEGYNHYAVIERVLKESRRLYKTVKIGVENDGF